MAQGAGEHIAHLKHVFVQVGDAPLAGVDGWQYLYIHRGGAVDEVALGGDVPRVADDDGHDGHTGLHRQVEGALLEGCKCGGDRTCPLWRQDHGLAFVLHGVHQRRHGVDGTFGVGPVDEYHAAQFQHLAQDRRLFLDLLFADAGDIAAQQLGQDDDIGLALVIEDKNRRTVRPQVLLANHIQLHPDQCAGGVGKQREGEVLGVAPGTGEGENGQPRHEGGHQAAGGGHRSDILADAGAAAAAEAGDRPLALSGDPGQFGAGVECPGVPDPLQQQQVIGAVRVEKTAIQVGAAALREPLGRIDLALAEAQGLDRVAGEFALADFQVAAQDMFDAQVGRRRLDLVGRGGGNDGYRVSPGDMSRYQGARFGIDQACDLPGIELLAHVVVGALLDAAHELGVDGHQPGKAEVAKTETGHRRHYLCQLPRRQVAAPDLLPDEGGGGVAGDDGAVKIEYGGDFRASGCRLDVLQKFTNRSHGRSPVCAVSITHYSGVGVVGRPSCGANPSVSARWSLPASCLWRHDVRTVHKKSRRAGDRDGVSGVRLSFFLPRNFFPARYRNTSPWPQTSLTNVCALPLSKLGSAYYRSAISWLAGPAIATPSV